MFKCIQEYNFESLVKNSSVSIVVTSDRFTFQHLCVLVRSETTEAVTVLPYTKRWLYFVLLFVCLMSTVALTLYFYKALILQLMFMILFVQHPLFCHVDTLLSHSCQVWALCALTPVVSNLCLILRSVCVCVCVFISAGCLCSRGQKRERRDWYASLTSFCSRHLSALSSLGFLFSTYSSQLVHTHLIWRENQSECFETDSICDQQLLS